MATEAEASTSKQAMAASDSGDGKEMQLTLPSATPTSELPTFASMSHLLSPPILVALSSLRFSHPTPVQAQVLPLALSGHDIVARARTGSGKTLAYALPVVQKIIKAKEAQGKASGQYQRTRALILVPTRELAEQVTSHVGRICAGSGGQHDVRVANIARDASASVHALALADRPDVVVATPSSALKALQQTKSLNLEALHSLVLDEADLLLSYGHDAAVRSLFALNVLPQSYQSYLMSATMSQDVEELRDLLAKGGSRKAQVLNLQDPTHHAHLRQYYVHLSEESKFLLVYVLLRLKLVRGKVLIFVNDVDRGYKVKLFLEAFGVKSCVLNAEMPANSRYHVVQEFNKGVYDVVIATDEASSGLGTKDEDLMEPAEKEVEEEAQEGEGEEEAETKNAEDEDEAETSTSAASVKRKRKEAEDAKAESSSKKTSKGKDASSSTKKSKPTTEYGVSRGIDFISVSCVINFDLPTSLSSYIHRIGRTARGHSTGIALSFVVPSHLAGKRVQGAGSAAETAVSSLDKAAPGGLTAIKGLASPTSQLDAKTWRKISRHMSRSRADVRPWLVHWPTVEGFRYRVEDALRATTTRVKVKEARKAEVAREMLRSERLQGWWEDNPRDALFLRHDVAAQKGGSGGVANGPGRHLKHVPAYLLPAGGRSALQERGEELRAPRLSEVDGEDGGGKRSRVSYDEHGRSLGYVGMRKGAGQRGGASGRGGRGRGRGRGGNAGGGGGRKKDPLRVGGGSKKR